MSFRQMKTGWLFVLLFLAGSAMSFLILKLERNGSSNLPITAEAKNAPLRIGRAQRIICGAPGLTEIVFSLGCGDRVAGVSQFSTFPAEALTKPKIGGLINPNLERILSLQPDLVLVQGKQEILSNFCRNRSIPFLSFSLETLGDIESTTRFLGRALHAEEMAQKLISDIQGSLNDIETQLKGRPKRRVFLTMGHTPGDLTNIMTTGPGTFLNEIISIAGGVNIFQDVSGKYPQISKETLIKREPEVIIEVFWGDLPADKEKILRNDWNMLSHLPAVRNNKIFFLTENFLLIPGVRIADAAKIIAARIHPEVFQ
jgi:iron complex transport system substrate-binding protein